MKLAIISDIHDNEAYLEAFLTWAKKNNIETLLVTGDVGTVETVEMIATFEGPIYFVFGNADNFEESDIPKKIISLGQSGTIELDHLRIGLCHQPEKIKKLLEEKPYIIFHGHTHIPWIKNEGETFIVNPGPLGGQRNPSTFAVWDTEKPLPELVRTDIVTG